MSQKLHWIYIYTASDPLAFEIGKRFREQEYITMDEMEDAAAVLVCVTNRHPKRRILRELRRILFKDLGLDPKSADVRAIRIGDVVAAEEVK